MREKIKKEEWKNEGMEEWEYGCLSESYYMYWNTYTQIQLSQPDTIWM